MFVCRYLDLFTNFLSLWVARRPARAPPPPGGAARPARTAAPARRTAGRAGSPARGCARARAAPRRQGGRRRCRGDLTCPLPGAAAQLQHLHEDRLPGHLLLHHLLHEVPQGGQGHVRQGAGHLQVRARGLPPAGRPRRAAAPSRGPRAAGCACSACARRRRAGTSSWSSPAWCWPCSSTSALSLWRWVAWERVPQRDCRRLPWSLAATAQRCPPLRPRLPGAGAVDLFDLPRGGGHPAAAGGAAAHAEHRQPDRELRVPAGVRRPAATGRPAAWPAS